MHKKTIIWFTPIDKVTDSAIMHMKKRELHNFCNHTILYHDDMCPSVVAAADSEGVHSTYTHIHSYILETRHLNTVLTIHVRPLPRRAAVPAKSTGNLILEIISFLFYAPKNQKQHIVSNSSENSTFVRYLLRPPFVLYYYIIYAHRQ